MKKITDLKENEVIHCPTEREAEAICLLMHNAGLEWKDSTSYLGYSFWKEWGTESCYNPSKGAIAPTIYYQDKNYKIHPASDFLPPHFYLGLPLYFVVKKDDSEEWGEYIKWLNKTFGYGWLGRDFVYYGYEGGNQFKGTNAYHAIESFNNNPTVFESSKEFMNIVNKNTMQTEVKIQVPQGYEIDKENSTFELIKFKKIERKFPKSWGELKSVKGCFVSSSCELVSVIKSDTKENNKNIFATEEQAKAARALAQLSQLKKVYREIEGGEIDWKMDTQVKYVICIYSNEIALNNPHFLAFLKPETRDLFFENFRDLIEQAKPLTVGE